MHPPQTAKDGVYNNVFPEDGTAAWMVVLGCWYGLFCTFRLVNYISVFKTYYISNQGPLHHYSQGAIFLSQGIIAAFSLSTVFNCFSGSSLGGVIMLIIINKLISCFGFPWTIRIVTFIILSLLAIAACTVRCRLPLQPKPFNITNFLSGIHDPVFSLTYITSFLFYWGLFIPFNYIILQAEKAGIRSEIAQYLLPIINTAETNSIPGQIIPGFLANKFGCYNIAIIITAIISIFCLTLWIPGQSQAAVISFMVMYSLFSGSFISLAPTLVTQISDIHEINTYQGIFFVFQSFGTLTGLLITEIITARQYRSFSGLQFFCGFSFLTLMAVHILARGKLVGMSAAKV
ncbi:MFS general substrate transporter [Aspergillus costaricaensis CBS 115574]|uniref:MFS general substrate transporter n=1 Tax=Aspergillus costaricaensis CBS 115574 TaxID=1448317 RepID=A0ACD1IFX7_9EURO|nr:MFS general substrate transporter [Aspergillus costaricaensis CBS 115574]RAK88657.1 MFS general substrate transporter [Aspergillus costaricaensis CBS 115574]